MIKYILSIVIGVVLANMITFIGYKYYAENKVQEIRQIFQPSKQSQSVQHYTELLPSKINITIKNGSNKQLNCNNYKNNQLTSFLILEGKDERNYENINEGEYIGCSIAIDGGSSTILTWFYAISSGVYTFLLEPVACVKCNGNDHYWATIVVKPDGQREYRKM